MVLVVDSNNNENVDLFLAAVNSALTAPESDHPLVAFDCEGVDLSRAGTVEVVALNFGKLTETDEVFLVDVSANGISSTLREKLKELLQSKTVVKVIHDVRMDSDALFHLHGITVDNIHDTGCYHGVLTGQEDISLNDMLLYYGISSIASRDKLMYKKYPNFWAVRPLTEDMKARASGDVEKLLAVAEKQMYEIDRRGTAALERARAMSSGACKSRDMMLTRNVKCLGNIGKFIGKGGDNLRSLQKRTGTLIYPDTLDKHYKIFHKDTASLTAVRRMMGY